MSTKQEIIYSILDVVKPENLTSGAITEEIVEQYIKITRAQLLRQDMNKGHTIDPYIIQSLGCISLVEADKSECCDYPTGCKILRSSVRIPSMIEMNHRQSLTRVGPVDLYSKPWQQIEPERVPYEGSNRFTKNLIKWFTMNNNGYIYLLIREGDLLNNSIEVMNVQGVLENPDDASDFTNCSTGESCFSSESPYPLKDHTVSILIEMVTKKMILMSSQPVDLTNDGKTNHETTISNGQ